MQLFRRNKSDRGDKAETNAVEADPIMDAAETQAAGARPVAEIAKEQIDVGVLEASDEAAPPPAGDAPASAPGTGPGRAKPFAFLAQPQTLVHRLHADLGFDVGRHNFAFAAKTRLVPVTLSEFPKAALSYPIVFVGPQKLPCAVMGVQPDTNLFIKANGAFEDERYIPGFLRQYPFALAKQKGQEQWVLLLDRDAPSITPTAEQKFFAGEQISDFTKKVVSFLTTYKAQSQVTVAFVKELMRHDLIENKTLKVGPATKADDAQDLVEYATIAVHKLATLPQDVTSMFHDKRYFAAIYAQHNAQHNWQTIVSRTMAEQRRLSAA